LTTLEVPESGLSGLSHERRRRTRAPYRDAGRARDRSRKLAAEQITRSGRRGQQLALTIASVRSFPGYTSQELAEKTGHDRYMLARRLPEAVIAGAVKKGIIAECSVTRRKALLWWPT
jgi:hypothetical protein